MSTDPSHLDKIRERFTATADVFAQSVRANRMELASDLADLATAGLSNLPEARGVDVACGPGTFTRPLARRVARAVGVDLTPAMVEKARAEAARDGITNIEFVCANIYELPFANGSADIVSCGYAVHHLTDPARALDEMARILRPGGRIAIVDIVLPDGCDAAIHNEVERVRDPSHAHTLSAADFHALFDATGLRLHSENFRDYWQDFDGWMKNAGSVTGDSTHLQVRAMLESSMNHDTSGFHPRRSEKTGSLEILHKVALLIAEKME